MSAIDSGKSYKTHISTEKDEKGVYKLYEVDYEVPCNCHPETCSHFSEMVWKTSRYKEYEDGTIVHI